MSLPQDCLTLLHGSLRLFAPEDGRESHMATQSAGQASPAGMRVVMYARLYTGYAFVVTLNSGSIVMLHKCYVSRRGLTD